MSTYQVPEGTKDIKIGTLIAFTVEADEDWKEIELSDTTKSPKASSASTEQPPSTPVTMEILPGQ